MRTAGFIVCVWVIGGCGGKPAPVNITGTYQATSNLEDNGGCGTDAPATDTPYFRLASGDLFGSTVYKYMICTAAQTSSCLDFGILSLVFDTPTANGWSGVASSGMLTSLGCTLEYDVSTATLRGSTLDVTFRTYRDLHATGITDAECTSHTAAQRGTNLPCVSEQLLVGNRVAP
jgi:hypothetical protein